MKISDDKRTGGSRGVGGVGGVYQIQMFQSNGAYIDVYTNCYYQTKENISKQIYYKIKEIIF